ncbi:hypothetical protein L1987_39084 [Smallanthus sonchifolius]|uniref:Uncharacterized protein n=1 Tax=Smallanthus sonchifolius TaxID=185202 RepID=A0ACB9HL24_9ASTR|nr:hypothetical protein L1987_39084 [Smallanthus sonchifolius]
MGQESSGRSKYFASEIQNQEDAKEPTSKRKVEKSSADVQPPHVHSLNDDGDDDGDETGKSSAEMTPNVIHKAEGGLDVIQTYVFQTD